MITRISPINLALDEDEASLRKKAAALLQVSSDEIREFWIVKKSLETRRKNRIHFVYAVELSLPPGGNKAWGDILLQASGARRSLPEPFPHLPS